MIDVIIRRQRMKLPLTVLLLGQALAAVSVAAQDGSIRQVSYGKHHLCVISKDGELVCWGSNESGQVGNGKGSREANEAREWNPSLIMDRDVSSVSAGSYHTCAVAGGALYCWGANFSGQIGNGRIDAAESKNNPKLPLRVIADGVKSVSAGGGYSCAVVGDELQCWGANWYGQMGIGTAQGDAITKPTRIIEGGVTAVATSEDGHTCAVVRGDLLCWGHNEFGQVGTGIAGADVLTPTKVLTGDVTAVNSGGQNTCAVRNGALWCWGANTDELLVPSSTTKAVANPRELIKSGVTAVSIGTRSICAVVNGGLQCWGRNHQNMLGTDSEAGTENVVKSPREVLSSGVTFVSIGEWGSCAVVNGALRCRGRDAYRSPDIRAVDFASYRQAKGDMRQIDHSAADIVAEIEKYPGRIAEGLKGKVIVHDDVAYLVTEATGTLIRGSAALEWSKDQKDLLRVEGKPSLSLNLNVLPLLPLKRQLSATDNSSTAFTLTISSDEKCGLVAGSPRSLFTTGFYLLDGNRFGSLHDVLQPTYPRLPEMASPGSELRMGVAAVRNVQSCAETIRVYREQLPYKDIQFQVAGEEAKYVPLVPDGSRNLKVDGELESIGVDSKGNDWMDYRIEVQTAVVMQCKETVLDHWKVWQSPNFESTGAYYTSSTDGLRLKVLASSTVNYSDEELRRALNAALGKIGMASEQDASDCLPAIQGQEFTVRYRGEVLQQIAADFKQPKPLLEVDCGQKDETMEVQCKPLPNDRNKSVKTLALRDPNTEAEEPGQGNYDLGLFIVKTGGPQMYSHYYEKNAYVSDAMRFMGLSIDTARYQVAPGLRAFGVRASYSGSSSVSSLEYTTMNLFIQQGMLLKKVLGALVMHRSQGEWSQACGGEVQQLDRTIEMGRSSSNGFSDLTIYTTTVTRKMTDVNNACVETQESSQTETRLLKFDGEKYVVPADLQ